MNELNRKKEELRELDGELNGVKTVAARLDLDNDEKRILAVFALIQIAIGGALLVAVWFLYSPELIGVVLSFLAASSAFFFIYKGLRGLLILVSIKRTLRRYERVMRRAETQRSELAGQIEEKQ